MSVGFFFSDTVVKHPMTSRMRSCQITFYQIKESGTFIDQSDNKMIFYKSTKHITDAIHYFLECP